MRYEDGISARYARLFADQKAGRAVMRMVEAQTWEGLSLVGNILRLAVEENGLRLGISVWEQRERKRIWTRSLAAPRRKSSRSRSPGARSFPTPTRRSMTPQVVRNDSQPRSSSVRSRTFTVDDTTEPRLPVNPNRNRMILSREERVSRESIIKLEKGEYSDVMQRFSGLKRRMKSIQKAEAGNARRVGTTTPASSQTQKFVENYGSVCDRLHNSSLKKLRHVEEPAVIPQFRARPVPAFLKRTEFPSQPTTPVETPISISQQRHQPQHDRMGTPLQSTSTPPVRESNFTGSVYDSMAYLNRVSPENDPVVNDVPKPQSIYNSDLYRNRISPREQEYTLDYGALMSGGVVKSALLPSPRAGAGSSVPGVASPTRYISSSGDGVVSGAPPLSPPPPPPAPAEPVDNLFNPQHLLSTIRNEALPVSQLPSTYGSRSNTPPSTLPPQHNEIPRPYTSASVPLKLDEHRTYSRSGTPPSHVIPGVGDELPPLSNRNSIPAYSGRSVTPALTAAHRIVPDPEFGAPLPAPVAIVSSEIQPPTAERTNRSMSPHVSDVTPKPAATDIDEIVYRAYSTGRSGSAGSDHHASGMKTGLLETSPTSPGSTSTNYYEIQALKMYYEADRAALVNTVAELQDQKVFLLEQQQEQNRTLFSNSISVITSSEIAQRDIIAAAEGSHFNLMLDSFRVAPPPRHVPSVSSEFASHVAANIYYYFSTLIVMTLFCFAGFCFLYSGSYNTVA
eukprot:TRINITY_DN4909_c1_g1_i2.p1 TRINITY_DN4909_c1_g1~~TRINITY_DN4909_c1_g1_i2.p1  ORF type:complete len:735 (+),score=108.54 TRINITY_DN4909_c1_g1_i2:42-2246(+)